MDFSIIIQGADEIIISENLPKRFSTYAMRHARIRTVSGGFGHLLFQQIDGKGFTIRYSNYFITSDTVFTAVSKQQSLGLHFSFCKRIECRLRV